MTGGPEISVIVAAHDAAREIGECLGSLAAQTLAANQYEVIVVLNGPDRGMRHAIDQAVRESAPFQLRLISSERASAGHARNLGLASAVGTHVCFVDHDDWVSPTFLEALLRSAAPGRVSMALLADVQPADSASMSVPDYVNYIGDVVNEHAGEVLPRKLRRTALAFNAAKLVPASVARSARYDESLASGEDLLYWFDVCTEVSFDVVMTPADSGAVYYRRLRPESLSRQPPSFEYSIEGRLDVIERLASRQLHALDQDLDRVRASLIAGQTSLMRMWLDENREQRPHVLEAIERRGLRHHMAWRVLNQGHATELAALVGFTPWLDTSGLVAARRVRARGALVDLIQVDISAHATLDHSSVAVAQEQVANRAVLEVPTTAMDWSAIKSYVRAGAAQAEEWEAEQGPYRSLYTRAMWPASHVLGAWLKVDRPDLHWRAEFSDPVVWNGYGQRRVGRAANDKMYRRLTAALTERGVATPERRNIAQLVELVAYAMADELVFTNEQQLEFMLARLPDPNLADRVKERATVAVHPTPDEELYHLAEATYVTDEGVVNIGYFGAFYPTRGLTEVVDAVQQLTPEDRAKVRIHVFTGDPQALTAELREHGLEDVICANPYAPYLEFLALTRAMDVLLVNDFRTLQHYDLNPYLPAKWSDYRGSGTDVWAVLEPGSVLSTMEMRYRSALGDVAGAVAVLQAAIADHAKG